MFKKYIQTKIYKKDGIIKNSSENLSIRILAKDDLDFLYLVRYSSNYSILVGATVLYLSPSVLNVLLATTTANVLGLAYIVLKGLFGKLILSLIFKIFRFRRQYRMSLHLTASANHYTHCLDSSQIHIFSKIFSQY